MTDSPKAPLADEKLLENTCGFTLWSRIWGGNDGFEKRIGSNEKLNTRNFRVGLVNEFARMQKNVLQQCKGQCQRYVRPC